MPRFTPVERRAVGIAWLPMVLAACAAEGPGAPATVVTWQVDPTPAVVIGEPVDDTRHLLGEIFGATRLPDGGILVGDRQDNALHFFGPDGAHRRSIGRQGSGPGEYVYPAALWRCGDQVLVYDIDGHLTSVLSLDGTKVRDFRFGAGAQLPGSSTPYRSVCNAGGRFAHYGWENLRAGPPAEDVFRPRVPFWLTAADSGVVAVLDSFPGAERVVSRNPRTGVMVGTEPRRFGRHTAIALASDRLYVGTGDESFVLAIDLASLTTDTIRLPFLLRPLTPEMIEIEKAVQLALAPPDQHRELEARFANHPFPETVPPYAALLVDAEDLLWVQEYPLANSPGVRWLVVNKTGQVLAEATLPSHLEVFEIGRDYILGRYIDPAESIPQVRVYPLRR